MRLLAKKKSNLVALFICASVSAISSSTRATVIYDGLGFELPSYSITGAAQFGDPDQADLWGQGPNSEWVPNIYPTQYGGNAAAADVETNVVKSGSQAVSLTQLPTSSNTDWEPDTFDSRAGGTPYNPISSQTPVIAIDWDMNIASGGSNTIFGIDFDNTFARIALLGVSTSGTLYDVQGSNYTPVGQPLNMNQWYHYSLQADFSAQTYKIFVDQSQVGGTFQFDSTASQFTSAFMMSYGITENAGANSEGTAYMDNYVISAYSPEPTSVCGLLLGGSLMVLNRRCRPKARGSAVAR
jgi:hypothetical protein